MRHAASPFRARFFAATSLPLSLIASIAFASWDPAGEPVPVSDRCATLVSAAACADGSRGLYTFWIDAGSPNAVVRAHRRLADGTTAPGWAAAGNTIGSPANAYMSLAAASDGAGGAYLIASDPTFGLTNRVQLWRLGADGARVASWPDSGLLLGSVAWPKDAFLASDGAGGVLVGWVEALRWEWRYESGRMATLNAVRLVRALSDGTVAPGWSALGNTVFEPDTNGRLSVRTQPTLIAADGSGGAWIAHADSSDGLLDARLFRMTAAGALAPGFPAIGVLVGSTGAEQLLAGIAGDGAGGVFTYGAFGTFPNLFERLAHFGASGAPPLGWTADGIDPLPGIAGGRTPAAIISDGAGGAVLADADYSSFVGATCRLLRVDASGVRAAGWPVDGLPLADTLSNGFRLPLLPDETGGAYLVGLKSIGSPNPPYQLNEMVAARVNGAGAFPPGWSATMTPVTGWDTNRLLCAVDDGRGDFFAVRSVAILPPNFTCGGVLAHRIGPDGSANAAVSVRVASEPSLVAAPNPSWQSVGLTLTVPEKSEIAIEVIDASGRRVRTLARRTVGAGTNLFQWNGLDDRGRPAPPGVYLIRARGPRLELSGKLVRVM